MLTSLFKQWSDRPDHPSAVLCSVVDWKGSVPRKDYPMMLVPEDGAVLGTIGGGSMELKVTQTAREMIGTRNSRLLHFDMTGDDLNADKSLCGGTLKVLIEAFDDQLENFMLDLVDEMSLNKKLMVKLEIRSEQKTRIKRQLIHSSQEITLRDPEIAQRLKRIFEDQQSRSFETGDTHYLLWQPFSPPAIHIFGAGHVGQAVATLAHFNELDVVVYDDREELLTPARYPYAQRVSICFPILWEEIPKLNEHDFVLIASREHRHDRELLQGVLQQHPAYVGLVSSARKWKFLEESLLANGVDPAAVSKVHAPVGLDIDAQTVPEIAVSILSQIIAEYRKKDP